MSPPGDDDKNRKAILARRARFMAAALAATGCEKPEPKVCLSVSPVQRFLPDGGWSSPDHGASAGQPTDPPPKPPPPLPPTEPREPREPRPHVCLSPLPPPPPSPLDPAQPEPCLRLAPPKPRPCLKPVLQRQQFPEDTQPKPAPDAGPSGEKE